MEEAEKFQNILNFGYDLSCINAESVSWLPNEWSLVVNIKNDPQKAIDIIRKYWITTKIESQYKGPIIPIIYKYRNVQPRRHHYKPLSQ